MTPFFLIKLETLITTVLNSFQSQFIILISLVSTKLYQGKVQLIYVYYQHRIVVKLLNNQSIVMSKPSTWFKVLSEGLSKAVTIVLQTLLNTVGEYHRHYSPVLSAILISLYLSYQTQEQNIRQICRLLQRKFILSSATDYVSRVRLVGLNFCIKGRTPREPVRPRKTVQRKLIGKQLNSWKIGNRASTLARNPELGSYSLWIHTSSR